MNRKQTCRIKDPELFSECKALLVQELGNIPDTTVITSALQWLKAARTQNLITVTEASEQAKRAFMPAFGEALTQALDVLMDARLLTYGQYQVEINPETNAFRLSKDGVIIEPAKKEQPAEHESPSWVDDVISDIESRPLTAKQAVN